MQILHQDGIRIAGICACLPKTAVRNETTVAEATGIRTRRIAAEGTTVVDLCVRSAERVLSDTGAKPEEFGAILCVSFTSRDRMPAAAVQAQARLGFPKGVIAFDVSLACSGWGYGLYLAGLLARETGKKVMLLDGDVQSAFTGYDEATVPLLADGGTATIVECRVGVSEDPPREPPHEYMRLPRSDSRKDLQAQHWLFSFVADGEKGGALRLSHGESIKMDGFGVFRFVATDVVACIKEFIHRCPPSPSTSTFSFVPHQPNAYMVRQLAKSVGIEEARTAISCDELGNLSSASVPATIAWKGLKGPVLFVGFGGGLSVSLGLIGLDDACTLSVLEV